MRLFTKALLLALASLALATAGAAQEPKSQDELLAAELASPFLRKAPWLTDWDQALAEARRDERLIFAYFTTVNY